MRISSLALLAAASALPCIDTRQLTKSPSVADPANPLNPSDSSSTLFKAATGALYLVERGAPDAPNGYTPVPSNCPSTQPSIREATSLSDQESSWRDTRIPNTLEPMRTLLARLNITGLDTDSYINDNQNNVTALPKIAIAASGGGYRALMNGAGALAAFDNRTTNSTGDGQLGGLLQSALYLAGLSGGGWLVGSIFQNNFTSVENIMNGNVGSVWDFTNSIFEGPNHGFQILTSATYYSDLSDQVSGKSDAGFNTTVTDYWGRALAYQLINANDGGPAYTWSSLVDGTYVTDGTAPLPLLVADVRRPGEAAITTNTTIVEFNPWEFGSWDPTIFGFAPMEYVGTNFSAGAVAEGQDCVRGYDSASFVMGTSSTLFNQFALQYSGANLPSVVNNFIQGLLDNFSNSEEDVASWVNPFYGWNENTNPNAHVSELTLVDGGENLENIPLHPLIQPVRGVDVIFAIDSSADTTYSWPNGTSLVATYERAQNGSLQNHTAFPSIPDQNTFVNLGLNTRPTFFGCDGTNNTHQDDTNIAPLIVYIPNTPISYFSNVSTFDPSYETAERNSIITNGYNVATRGNSSEEMWPTCVGCAILQRSLLRTGTAIPDVCTQCFTTYCWDGTLNSTTPSTTFEPAPVVANTSGAIVFKPEVMGMLTTAVAAGFVLFL